MLYFTLLVYIVFFIKRRNSNQDYRNTINIHPFKEKLQNLKTINSNDLSMHKDFFMDLFGNIFLFIPFPLALIWLFSIKMTNIKIFILLVLTSASIEVLQFIFNKGVSDIDDIILNTIGGFLGLLGLHFSSKIKKSN